MENWKKKVIIDAAKSFLPFQKQLRLLKRYFFPYQDNHSNSLLALRQGLSQIELLKLSGKSVDGTVLEFGTGWIPIIPLLFHIAGAKKIILTDVESLMDSQTIIKAKNLVKENSHIISDKIRISNFEILQKIDKFSPEYVVPWVSTDMKSQSVDYIISRAVFEHVPPDAIIKIFGEFRRIIKNSGAMCHIIDNSDHSEHHDKSISRVHFLSFDKNDFWWKATCKNQQNYQNRLRHSDYKFLLENSGWSIALEDGEPDAATLARLPSINLSSEFLAREESDLAILTSSFVAFPTTQL